MHLIMHVAVFDENTTSSWYWHQISFFLVKSKVYPSVKCTDDRIKKLWFFWKCGYIIMHSILYAAGSYKTSRHKVGSFQTSRQTLLERGCFNNVSREVRKDPTVKRQAARCTEWQVIRDPILYRLVEQVANSQCKRSPVFCNLVWTQCDLGRLYTTTHLSFENHLD